jgi:PAS domain S-box-containing protein
MADHNSLTESTGAASIAFHDIIENSRIIAETASDAIITISEHSTILFVNRAATNIFGYTTEEMLGAELTMLMPEYLRHVHRAGLKNYVETGRKHISWELVELPGLHKNGKEISLELSFGEFRKDGVRFFTGIARDITKRKQDERRVVLQHSVTGILAQAASPAEAAPKLLETICTNLSWQLAALWSVTSDQNELHCVANWQTSSSPGTAEFEAASRRFHFHLGEDLPGKVWASKQPIWVSDFGRDASFPRSSLAALGSIHTAFAFPIVRGDEVLGVIELLSDQIQNDDQSMQDTLVGIGSQIGQFIERKKGDEERLLALSSAYEARLEAEALTKQLVALQRMTDAALAQLTVEEVLAESLSRMREVLNVDTAAILLLRAEGDELVAWAAQGLEEEVELGVRIPVGRGFAGKVVEQGKPIIIDDIGQADVYNPLLKQKGIKSLLGVPLLVEGRPIGVIHVGKLEFTQFKDDDVRLLQSAADRIALAIENARLYQVEKSARAEAEGANRAKDEFLTILSHELRTPLTPIIGWVHMMQNGILPQGEFSNALSVINRNAYNLKRLINDLLDMSAILSGKMQIEETYVSLAGVLEESVETMRPYARDAKVQLRLKSADETVMIKGDRSRLNQTFCNVIHNAIKFSPAGGVVQVASEASNSEANISIKDQGEGIPVEFLPHVFERFRQADGSRTRSYGGLGLGLSLVKSFVEAHRGSVEATSEGHGKGSVFTIKLPCEVSQREPGGKAEHKAGLDMSKIRRRILIVEDQPDTLEMLAANFQARGFETLLCNSAAEAFQVAEREHVDVLISDLAMPGTDGLQLIRNLRQRKGLENTPAIALTGYASQNDADAAIAAGFDLHLSKPIDPMVLADAIDNLLVSRLK